MATERFGIRPQVFEAVQWKGSNLAEMQAWLTTRWRPGQEDGAVQDGDNLLIMNPNIPEQVDYTLPLNWWMGPGNGDVWEPDSTGGLQGMQKLVGSGPFEYQIESTGS